jgi:hypothetical protein
MTPHEALCNALAVLSGGADGQSVDGATLEDTIDEISELVMMFEPYAGDDRAEAGKRTPHPCHCANCGLVFLRFYLPATASRVARMVSRGAFCPRCYATDGIMITWDTEHDRAPRAYVGTLAEAGLKRHPFTLSYDLNVTLKAFGDGDTMADALDEVRASDMLTIITHPKQKAPRP